MPSPAANELTRAHRSELAALAALVARELGRLTGDVAADDVDAWWRRTRPDVLTLVASMFASARRLGTRYLRRHSALEGVTLEPAQVDWSSERAQNALRVTGPVALKRHVASTGDTMGATRVMRRQMAASAQRLALDGSRETVARTVETSDSVAGWRRVTDEDPCFWCAMLASRGAAYKTAESAGQVGRSGRLRGSRTRGTSYHDGDQCTVEPVYEREQEPDHVEDLFRQWQEVTAGRSGADAIRVWRRYWGERDREVDVG